MTERWKRIPSAPAYEVSDAGRVRNAERGNVLTPWAHRSGHLYINLGRKIRWQVHRLVLLNFGPAPPPGDIECRHLDGNPTNNRIENLCWGTRAENVADLKRTSGRYAKAMLTDEAANKVRAMFTGKHGDQTRIARRLGLSLSMVNRIVRGRTYARTRA